MKKTKLITEKVAPAPDLRYVKWGDFCKPGICNGCLEPISACSFGYIDPASDLRYHDKCKPPGRWNILI